MNSYTINTRICEERAFVLPNNALVTTNEISTVQLHIGKFKLSLQVYIVPEISHNLISVNQLVQLGYDYHFTDGVFLLTERNNPRVSYPVAKLDIPSNLTIGPIQDVHYDKECRYRSSNPYNGWLMHIQNHLEYDFNYAEPNISTDNDIWKLHIQSNHLSKKKMKHLIQTDPKYKGIKPTKAKWHAVENCPICKIVNISQINHKDHPQNAVRYPLEKIVTDTIGPITIKGVKYYLTTLIDTYLGYTSYIFKDSKSITNEVIHLLQHWQNIQSNFRMLKYRADNAPEFPLPQVLFNNFQMLRDVTASYQPKHYNMAESHNRLIMKGIRTVIMNFPNNKLEITSLLPEIIDYSIYLKNNSLFRLQSGNQATPYELFHSVPKYNINHVAFGQDCLIYLNHVAQAKVFKIQTNKLIPSTIIGFFLGYTQENKMYLIKVKTGEGKWVNTVSGDVTFLSSNNNIKTYFSTLKMLELETWVKNIAKLTQLPSEKFIEPNIQTKLTKDNPVLNTEIDELKQVLQRLESQIQSSFKQNDKQPSGLEHSVLPNSTVNSENTGLHQNINTDKQFPAITQQTSLQVNPNVISTHGTTHGNWGRTMVTTSNFPMAVPSSNILTPIDIISQNEETVHSQNQSSTIDLADQTGIQAERSKGRSDIDTSLEKTEMNRINTPTTDGQSKVEQKTTSTNISVRDVCNKTGKSRTERQEIGQSSGNAYRSNRHLRPPSPKAHISETPNSSSSDSTEGGKAILRAKSASVNCPRDEADVTRGADKTPKVKAKLKKRLSKRIRGIFDKDLETIQKETKELQIKEAPANADLEYELDFSSLTLDSAKSGENLNPKKRRRLQDKSKSTNISKYRKVPERHPCETKAPTVTRYGRQVKPTFKKQESSNIAVITNTKQMSTLIQNMILLNISNDRNQPDRPSYRDTQEKDSRLNIKKSSVEQISNLQLNAVVRSINFHDPNWHDARMREYHKFVTNEVFEVVPLPENVRLLPTKWVYTHKTTELKENAFKARCVVMGNRQIENLHYDPYRISLTVIDMATIRLLTAIAVEWAYNMHHIDIAGAYLNASLESTDGAVYLRPPRGFDDDPTTCWKARRAIYGLRQSGFLWNIHLQKLLQEMGLKQTQSNPNLFFSNNNGDHLFVGVYVDDLFVVAKDQKIFDEFFEVLGTYLQLNYSGHVKNYLGIDFIPIEGGIRLSQESYINDLLQSFDLETIINKQIPRPVNYKQRFYNEVTRKSLNHDLKVQYKDEVIDDNMIKEHGDPEKDQPLDDKSKQVYQSTVGKLAWIAMNSQPAISYAVNALGAKNHCPTIRDYEFMIFCVSYLRKHKTDGIDITRNKTSFTEKFTIYGYSDASFAADSDRMSTTGYCIFVNGNLIAWKTKKQKNVTKSSQASELVALGTTVDITEHIQSTLKDLETSTTKLTIFEDNKAVISAVKNRAKSSLSRHVDIILKSTRQKVLDQNLLDLYYIQTDKNIADMFTKELNKISFTRLKQALLDTGGLTNPEVLDAIKRLKIQTDIGDQIRDHNDF